MEQFHTTHNSGSSSSMLLGVLVSVAMWLMLATARAYF